MQRTSPFCLSYVKTMPHAFFGVLDTIFFCWGGGSKYVDVGSFYLNSSQALDLFTKQRVF